MRKKTCISCQEGKKIDDFRIDSRTADGHQAVCKSCARLRDAVYRSAPGFNERRKSPANKRYDQSDAGKARHRRYNTSNGKERYKRYKESHPQRIKARTAVWTAIDRGTLPRPTDRVCQCGASAETYHHHQGYSKEHWLDVIALCWPCHRAIDSGVDRK